MPRASKASGRRLGSRTLVVDHGGHSIKAGFVPSARAASGDDCRIIPNCIARGMDGPRSTKIYIGDQLDDCKDFAEMSFRRPVEKGFVVSWDAELDVWKQAFLQPDSKLHCDPRDTNLILTEAPNCPQALQHNTDQIIFEELEFASAFRTIGSTLNAYNDTNALFEGDEGAAAASAECLLVVDSGYSHTTVTPIFKGKALQPAIRRLDIGGRFLTNRLKELISLRHFNLMDDSHLVEQIKEDVSYVSQDFVADLERAQQERLTPIKSPPLSSSSETRKHIVLDYVLPDYHNTFRGHVRPHEPRHSRSAGQAAHKHEQRPVEDALTMGNERFVGPELIFAPSDIGMAQAGLAEIIVQSLEALPAGMWPAMLANVVVVGGSAQLAGFVERLDAQLQSLVPSECVVRVQRPSDPVKYTWLGGANLAANEGELRKKLVTREEYQEHGAAWTARQFLTR